MDGNKFRQVRRLTAMFKFALDVIQEIKFDHDQSMEKLEQSLFDMEDFAKEKGVDLEFCHLANHANFLTEDKVSMLRKKILDFGNSIKREIEGEQE